MSAISCLATTTYTSGLRSGIGTSLLNTGCSAVKGNDISMACINTGTSVPVVTGGTGLTDSGGGVDKTVGKSRTANSSTGDNSLSGFAGKGSSG